MTRRAGTAFLLVALAVSGWGQTLTGTWSTKISLLPSAAVRSAGLSLSYTAPRWKAASFSEFSSLWGWVWQGLDLAGALPFGTVEGVLLFGPAIPDFLYAHVVAGARVGQGEVRLYTAMVGPALGGPLGGAVLTADFPLGGNSLRATFGLGASLPEDGFTIGHVSGLSRTYPVDPRPGGSQFTQATVSLTAVRLCCGTSADVHLRFTKAGFDSIVFTVKDVGPICCGVSFDLGVKFTTTVKTVSITPKFGGLATACVELYADVVLGGGFVLDGIRVDGWKLACTISDCTEVAFVTFLSPGKAGQYGYEDVLVPGCGEFAWVELSFCGAGCCGGRYALDLKFFFGTAGAVFGLTRVVGSAKIPLMANFLLLVELAIPAAGCAGDLSLCLGWEFTF